MNYSLENIFSAITPDTIKNIPIVSDAMKIFVEVLNEYSSTSIEIRNILNDNSPEVIKNELVKIYLNDIYRVLYAVQNNKQISEKIDKYNAEYGSEYIKRDILGTISNTLNSEHFVTTRSYKQKKGTVAGIRYIYDMIENIITTTENKIDITVIEKEPFNLKIEGSMMKELYDNVVRPLAHPLGFVYTYVTIVKLVLEDEFNLIHHYNNSVVEVRCLSGNVDPYDKTIIKVTEDTISGRNVTRVYFDDNSYIEQWLNPIEINYYENNVLIKTYPSSNHCSLYLQYDYVLELATKDEISFKETKSIDEDWYLEEGLCDLIGNGIIVGQFVVGRKYRPIKDFVSFRETLEVTRASIDYEIFIYEGSYVIGSFTIGEDSTSRIGGSLELVHSDTSEIYDIRTVQEEFEISTISAINIQDSVLIQDDLSLLEMYSSSDTVSILNTQEEFDLI